MREIKFRAWDKHTNDKNLRMWEWDEIRYSYMNDIFDDQIDRFELLQYTGLKDKNGKDIYEGDIVKMHYFFENFDNYTLGAYEDEEEIIGIVKIDELSTYTDCPDNRYDWINYLQEPSEELEVIGNIYENPELLEV